MLNRFKNISLNRDSILCGKLAKYTPDKTIVVLEEHLRKKIVTLYSASVLQ